MTDGNEGLVRVATAPNPIIAASWQEVLRGEGIPSMVRIDDPLSVAYQVSSFYPCGIYVLSAFAEAALKVIGELVEEAAGEESTELDDGI